MSSKLKLGINLIHRISDYRLFRTFNWPNVMPMSLTVGVTNVCNSHCKTCLIWKLYRDHTELKNEELKTWEYETIFEHFGKSVFWVTLTGGEPFLRSDLPEICMTLIRHCESEIINIPTNALLPKVIEEKTKKILENCQNLTLVVNLSLDGVGSKHDEIRGTPGNFDMFLETYAKLKSLKEEFPHLQVGIHSVISKFNIDDILHIYEYVKQLGPDSYITEIAEQRTELFNTDKEITPNPEKYTEVIHELSYRVADDYLRSNKSISRITQALRLMYYQLVVKELRENRQIVPCYAGYASCQITPYGDVWPCCVLGYDKPMGNLRENDYDFRRIWFSQQAEGVRSYIKAKSCTCPLANAHYTNILCNLRSMCGVLKNILASNGGTTRGGSS